MSGAMLWILNLLFITYVLIGGFIFWALEGPSRSSGSGNSTQLIANRDTRYNATDVAKESDELSLSEELSSVTNIPKEIQAVAEAWLKQLPKGSCGNVTCHALQMRDVVKLLNKLRNPTPWNLPGSIFFSLTVVTTIGYGNLVPATKYGRAFCCVYAFIGIPLCLLVLVKVGNEINTAWRMIDERFERRRPRVGKYVRSALVLVTSASVILLLPSFIFSRLEGWDFGTGVYFSFVSLSTIGFGDFVAGSPALYTGWTGGIYRISVAAWILIGLSWVAGIISWLQDRWQWIIDYLEVSFNLVKHRLMSTSSPVAGQDEMMISDRLCSLSSNDGIQTTNQLAPEYKQLTRQPANESVTLEQTLE